MQVDLSPELESFIDSQVAKGRYGSIEEFLQEALSHLRSQIEEDEASVRRGIADAEAGRVRPLDEVAQELKARFSTSS